MFYQYYDYKFYGFETQEESDLFKLVFKSSEPATSTDFILSGKMRLASLDSNKVGAHELQLIKEAKSYVLAHAIQRKRKELDALEAEHRALNL